MLSLIASIFALAQRSPEAEYKKKQANFHFQQ